MFHQIFGVSFKDLAASGAFEESFHKIDAQPPTYNRKPSILKHNHFIAKPQPNAPPLAPSPITIDKI